MSPDAASTPARRPATSVTAITGLRFLPDRVPATLVNMSATGLLVECGTPLRVGTDTAVLFEGGFSPDTVTGRVARCEVAVMGRDGTLRYLIGVEFDAALGLSDEAMTEPAAPDPGHVRNSW
jgi:hypothetical protein